MPKRICYSTLEPQGHSSPFNALTAVVESLVSRVEVVCGQRPSRKRPPPSPAHSVSSGSEAAVDMARPVGLDTTLPDPSDSEDDSSMIAAAKEKSLVDALVITVREALKLEVVANVATDVVIPFDTHKAPHAAKVFPYLPYFDKFGYKD